MMDKREWSIFGVIVGGCILLAIGLVFGATSIDSARAQDTAPTWEYAAMIYDPDTETAAALAGDVASVESLNAAYAAMSDDEKNLVSVLNVMGAAGWEFMTIQIVVDGTDIYLFKRAG